MLAQTLLAQLLAMQNMAVLLQARAYVGRVLFNLSNATGIEMTRAAASLSLTTTSGVTTITETFLTASDVELTTDDGDQIVTDDGDIVIDG